jgi:hypothetical protein
MRVFKALGGHAGDNRRWPDIEAWAGQIARDLRAQPESQSSIAEHERALTTQKG